MRTENTRRNFLKMAPAASAAAMLATDAAAALAVSPELADLIARYVEREKRVREADDRSAEIEESEEYVRLSTMTMREAAQNLEQYPERLLDTPIRCERQLDEFFTSVNAMFAAVTRINNHPVYGMPHEEVKRRLEHGDDYHRCLELLKKRHDDREAWLRSIGYYDLRKIVTPGDGVERALHAQIIEFPCRNLADVIAKAEFAGEWIFRECDQEELFALIKSMIPARPEARPLHA